MTTQNPDGRYLVFSSDKYRNFPDAVPAGRYERLRDAIMHADSVAYKMVVVDSQAESQGLVYINWDRAPTSSPWGRVQHSKQLADGIWSVTTESHGGIYLSDMRLAELTKILGYEFPTFCGSPNWFEEDCDWVIPFVAFGLKYSYEAACKQLRAMARSGSSPRFLHAYDELVAAKCILDVEKVKQAMARRATDYQGAGHFDHHQN